jgi:hypothetical protein
MGHRVEDTKVQGTKARELVEEEEDGDQIQCQNPKWRLRYQNIFLSLCFTNCSMGIRTE